MREPLERGSRRFSPDLMKKRVMASLGRAAGVAVLTATLIVTAAGAKPRRVKLALIRGGRKSPLSGRSPSVNGP
jgi:ribosomal protein L28